MSAKARAYEAQLTQIVFAAGAKIIAKGLDGAGHRTLTVSLNGHQRLFHFPSTGCLNGHGFRNTQARLRRLLREVPPPPESIVEASSDGPVPAPVPPAPLPTIRKPPRPRLKSDQRREIAKRYLVLPSIDTLINELGLPRPKVETIILSHRGQAAEKLRRERTIRAQRAAKRLRNPTPAPETVAEPTPLLKDTLPRARLQKAIQRMYFRQGMTAKEVAALVGYSVSAVLKLARG